MNDSIDYKSQVLLLRDALWNIVFRSTSKGAYCLKASGLEAIFLLIMDISSCLKENKAISSNAVETLREALNKITLEINESYEKMEALS